MNVLVGLFKSSFVTQVMGKRGKWRDYSMSGFGASTNGEF